MAVLQLPGPLRLTPSFPFVGRSRELATLRTLLPRAEGEGRRVALVGGEPGSGKSRLVREFAHEAVEEGALVLHGACDAVVRTPYRPFVEALDHLVRVSEPSALRSDLGTAGAELARLLPDLPLRIGGLPAPVAADPDTERHRLHTAVTDLLTSVSRRQPLLLVLEDGHWSDTPTLLLLRHVGRAAGDARMLVLATFRDTEADVPAELSETLVDLRRSEAVTRIPIGGLTSDEIADFVRGVSGGGGSDLPELARAIAELTGGNPFLVTELWRTIETGAFSLAPAGVRLTSPLAEVATPASVREVVSQRLNRLAPSTAELLELAAVVGPIFKLRVLEHASPGGGRELIAGLDEAVHAGIVEEVSSTDLSYRFTHELVRRAVLDRLGAVRRAQLHLAVGEALELAYEDEIDRVLADLAHHYTAAAPIAGAQRAIAYNLRAAASDDSALAFEEAAARLETAIDLGIDDPRARGETLLRLGNVRYRGGKYPDALTAYRAAAGIARSLGDAELLARAAIGFEEACWRPAIVDEGALELLEEAVAALGEGDSPLRVLVLAGLSRANVDQGDHARGALVRESAIEMARRVGEKRSLAQVLVLGHRARGTSTLEELLDQLTEARDIGEELGDSEMIAQAMGWRVPTYMALSDLGSARRETLELLAVGGRVGRPFMLHIAEQYRAAIALSEGDLEEAEEAGERSHEWSRLLAGRDASGVYGIQMFSVRREQGRLAELAPVVRVLAAGDRAGAWRPGLAAMLAELGMEGDVRRELAGIAREGLEPLRESLWLASLTYLTDASAAVGDEATATLVYPHLEAHAGTNVMIGYGVVCYGAADRYLGMLARTLGDWDRAEAHFEEALELNGRMGAATWLARTEFEYGRMLLARGPARDRTRAEALLAEAARRSERIGMRTLRARIGGGGLPVGVGSSLPDGLSGREGQILRLLAQGLSNRQIGRELFISEHTVANHVRSILRKTGCANRTEAASYAHLQGLVEA